MNKLNIITLEIKFITNLIIKLDPLLNMLLDIHSTQHRVNQQLKILSHPIFRKSMWWDDIYIYIGSKLVWVLLFRQFDYVKALKNNPKLWILSEVIGWRSQQG